MNSKTSRSLKAEAAYWGSAGKCQCGCGEDTTVAKNTDRREGWVKGQPKRFISGHNTRLREKRDASVRFWEKVIGRDETDACWVWTGARGPGGYGRFQTGTKASSKTVQATRFAYEDRIGPIPGRLDLDHLCHNPPCVNPAHLEPVTNAENQRRRRKMRCVREHIMDGANVYVRPSDGQRRCKKCHVIRERNRYLRKREARV